MMTAKVVSSTIVVMFVLVAVSMSVTSWFAEGGAQKSTKEWFKDEVIKGVTEVCKENTNRVPASGHITHKFVTHNMNIINNSRHIPPGAGPGPERYIDRFVFQTFNDDGDLAWEVAIAGESVCEDVRLNSVSGGATGAGSKNFTIEDDGSDKAVIKVEDN